MARLLEYQGKALFRRKGIPVPEGRTVRSAEEALSAADELGFPVVVKAQVHAGGRGKAGAILFAEDQESVTQAVRELLAKQVHGAPVRELLIEKKADIEQEVYAAITADPSTRQPIAIFSPRGGMDVEQTADEDASALFSMPIDILRGLYYYDALNLLRKDWRLDSRRMFAVANLYTNLYRVYREYDCKLAEINPLVLTAEGPVAVDARVDIDDDALARQTALDLEVAEEAGERAATALEIAAGTIDEHDHRGSVHFVQIDPTGAYARAQGKVPIGFDCVGAGTSLTTMDELVPLG
jgi:succinyl-CoA synthetase beta subunit